MPLSDDDYRDIQGLVRFGYRHLEAARFHLLTIADAAAARAWLSKAPVTTAVKGHRPDVALQVAFTYEGLQRLGGAPGTLVAVPVRIQVRNDRGRAERAGSATSRPTIRNGGSGAAPASCRTCWCCSMPSRRIGWTNGKRS